MIIGISGLAGSGKDTCADFLVRDHGFVKVALADLIKRMVRDVFGFSYEQLWGPSSERNKPDERYPREHGPHIKHDGAGHDWEQCQCCGALYELHDPRSGGTPSCFLTTRFALQKLGTEWGRLCYPNVWIDYVARVHQEIQRGNRCYDAQRGLTPLKELTLSPAGVVVPDVRFKNEIDGLRAHGAKLIRIVRSSAGLSGAAGQHTSETEQASIPDGAFDTVIQNDGTLAELGEAVTAWLK
jgi:hypothetical protein